MVVKVNPNNGAALAFADDDVLLGEPVFARRPDGTAEADGVVLTVGSFENGEQACLQILESERLQPMAQATVDVPLPLGFHCSFARRKT